MTKKLIFLFIILSSSVLANSNKYYLTVMGVMKFADGIGRLPICFIDMLHKDLKINFISSRLDQPADLTDVSQAVKQTVLNTDKTPGDIALFTDLIWLNGLTPSRFVPNSYIKIAYSMLESTAIPPIWKDILNKNFDAVVVPDSYFKTVYKNSGVKIPIFVLPLPVYIQNFLAIKPKTKPNKLFTFGISCGFFRRKNHEMLLKAFALEFSKNKNVQLIIHGRFGLNFLRQNIFEFIKKNKLNNVIIIDKILSHQEYIKFMSCLDCYVYLSKGEGFSVSPREALALGIPCILSDNTAHKTICDTGLVRAVQSTIKEPAYYDPFGMCCGYHFNCNLSDARAALRDVYNNYFVYLEKAQLGRDWVKQYLDTNLKQKYITLLKPQKIKLCKDNFIGQNCLYTSSYSLYCKFMKLRGQDV